MLRANGLNARQRDLKIGVARDGLLDEAVQLGIAQGLPPADGIGIGGGLLRDDLARGGAEKRRAARPPEPDNPGRPSSRKVPLRCKASKNRR